MITSLKEENELKKSSRKVSFPTSYFLLPTSYF
jgi:hypothetical protein